MSRTKACRRSNNRFALWGDQPIRPPFTSAGRYLDWQNPEEEMTDHIRPPFNCDTIGCPRAAEWLLVGSHESEVPSYLCIEHMAQLRHSNPARASRFVPLGLPPPQERPD